MQQIEIELSSQKETAQHSSAVKPSLQWPILSSLGLHVLGFTILTLVFCPWVEKKTASSARKASFDFNFLLEQSQKNGTHAHSSARHPVLYPKKTETAEAPSKTPAILPANQAAESSVESTLSWEGKSNGSVEDYLRWVVEHNEAPAYPRLARIKGEAGRVVVTVRVQSNGKLASDPVLAASSQSALLDKEVLNAVRGWQFPNFQAARSSIEFSIPFRFSLTEE